MIKGIGIFEMSQLSESEIDGIIRDLDLGERTDEQILADLAARADRGELVSTGNLAGYRIA